MSLESIAFSAGGGAVAGYATGRITKIAVNVLKWILLGFAGIMGAFSQAGLITIHYGRVGEVMTSLFGGTGVQSVIGSVQSLLFSFIPMSSGFGVGFYAGYKKMLV